MNDVKLTTIGIRHCWEGIARQFLDYNYRQSWEFAAAIAARDRATNLPVAMRFGEEIVGLANVRVKQLPLVGGGIAYVGGGPLVRRRGFCDVASFRSCLIALREEFAQRRGLILRILAPPGSPEWNTSLREVFGACDFVPTNVGYGYRTILVDLDRPLEKIRAALAQKWRNCLNQAERNRLEVRSSCEANALDDFRDLFQRFVHRKRFAVELGAEFYAAIQRVAPAADRFTITWAEQDHVPVAAHVGSLMGDVSVYILGAGEPAAMRSKAAYLLQWSAIRQARDRGMRWYDLGGIDEQGNPGVFHFKSGLGGVVIEAAGPFEFAPRGIRSVLTCRAEKLYRWKVRRVAANASRI
jgi:hypothetical protein